MIPNRLRTSYVFEVVMDRTCPSRTVTNATAVSDESQTSIWQNSDTMYASGYSLFLEGKKHMVHVLQLDKALSSIISGASIMINRRSRLLLSPFSLRAMPGKFLQKLRDPVI